jgi:hypothetical protein
MKIFKHFHILNKSDIPYIQSFSDHHVKIRGMFSPILRLSKSHSGLIVPMYVTDDIPNVPPLLLGNDMLKLGMVTISYTGSPSAPYPEVIFKNPSYHECIVYFESCKLLYTCEANCLLDPYEIKDVEFYLPKAAPVTRTDHILITSHEWDTISIIPSRSDLEYVDKLNKYVAIGRVANLSNKIVSCQLRGKYELINNYNIININNDNRGRLAKAMQKYPLAREVLYSKENADIHLPLITVNQITAIDETDIQVSDLDYADVIMAKEPTFDGEAEIIPEIIEPSGLDLPTVILIYLHILKK